MRLPKRWTLLRYHPEQRRLWNSLSRFRVVPAGRRSGKTELAKRKLVKSALLAQDDSPAFFAAAPTRDQAKHIFWADLKALSPKTFLATQPKETDLEIEYINGAIIRVVGMDKPERIEGTPWDGGVLDEYGNMKKKAWGESVRPALADRQGWCWLIGVPEGRNHYYDIYKKAQADDTGEWDVFWWKSADILPASEIEAAKRDLDELTFLQEFEGSFVNFQGQAYYPFNEKEHCGKLKYDNMQPLIFCFDFNVAPGTAAVCQEQLLPNGLLGTGVIGEVWIPQNSNTPAVCRKLVKDWGSHKGKILCYGDATGGSKGSAKVAGSDWDLIREEMRSAFGDRVEYRVKNANPRERARVNAVNSRLKSQSGEIKLMVDVRRALHVVKDFEGVRTLEGGSGEIDKKATPELTHLCFAAGTMVDTDKGCIAIENLPKTGKIRTWDNSFVDYNNPGCRGVKDVVEVELSNGEKIICTPDHSFLTEKGWVKAIDSLGLLCYNRLLYNKGANTWKTNLNFLGRVTGGMEDILSGAKNACIGLYGNIIKARYLKVGVSTILTETNGIMTYQTSRSCLYPNICLCIWKIQEEKQKQQKLLSVSMLIKQRDNGTGVQRAESGIQSMAKKFMRTFWKNRIFASNAKKNIKPNVKREHSFFVQKHVRQRIAEKAVLIIKSYVAKCAAKSLAQANILKSSSAQEPAILHIAGVHPVRERIQVYCPIVKKTGCFVLANGLVVSNSDGIGYYIDREFPIKKAQTTVEQVSIY